MPKPIGFLEPDFVAIPCNRWCCPHCGKIKRNKLADKVKLNFNSENSVVIVLTQRYGSKRNILKDWSYFKLIMKRHGMKIESYFWVKEFTKKGQRHLHIIISGDEILALPFNEFHKQMKDMWSQVTGGESFIVWVNSVKINNTAGYLMKYLTKTFGEDDIRFLPKERRFGFSQNCKKLPEWISWYQGDFWEVIINPERKFTLELMGY